MKEIDRQVQEEVDRAAAFAEELERDQRVFLMGEGVGVMGGVFSVTRGLADKFGRDRVRDTPISEMAILGSAMGAALTEIPPRQGLKEYRKAIFPGMPCATFAAISP